MKRILDPEFEYTPAAKTDIRKTFARVRREQKRQEEQAQVYTLPPRKEQKEHSQ